MTNSPPPPDIPPKAITNRLAVSLVGNDDIVLDQLRVALEKRLNVRLSLAEVVRIALRNQAQAEGVTSL